KPRLWGVTNTGSARLYGQSADAIRPRSSVFFCGTNDLLRRPVHTVLEDFKTFLRRLWAVYPSTQVYFVSVPHAPSRERICAKGDSLNSLVQNLADNHDALIYVDVVDAMYDSQGEVREE